MFAEIKSFYLGTRTDTKTQYSLDSDELQFNGDIWFESDEWDAGPAWFQYRLYPTEKLILTVDILHRFPLCTDIWMHLKPIMYDRAIHSISSFIHDKLGDISVYVEPYKIEREKYVAKQKEFKAANKTLLGKVGIATFLRRQNRALGAGSVDTTHLDLSNIIGVRIDC